MRFLRPLFWESIQNLPMIMGFMVAARLLGYSFLLALLALMTGILLGNLVMHITEPKLHTEPTDSTLKGTFINIVAFVVLSIPFLFYFTADNLWFSWRTDLILGVAAGILLTLVQSTAWEGDKSRMLLHGLAMAVSFPLIIIGIRGSLTIDSWLLMLLAGALITILASAVIVLIDYQSILKEDTGPVPS